MRRPIVVGSIFFAYGLVVACGIPDPSPDAPSKTVQHLDTDPDSPLVFTCDDPALPLPPATLTPMDVPIAPAPTPKIADASIDQVIGVINACADSGPYSPTNICTTSCNRLHARCKIEGIGCRTATLMCLGSTAGHAINVVQIPGKGWCAVDTTASPVPPFNSAPKIYEPCFDDPRKVVTDPQLACRVMGIDTDGGPCPCTFDSVIDQQQPVNYDPKACRVQNPTDTDACRECCTTDGVLQYCKAEGIECKDYLKQCLTACAAPAPEAGTDAATKAPAPAPIPPAR
jgi:hypothetical protein